MEFGFGRASLIWVKVHLKNKHFDLENRIVGRRSEKNSFGSLFMTPDDPR